MLQTGSLSRFPLRFSSRGCRLTGRFLLYEGLLAANLLPDIEKLALRVFRLCGYRDKERKWRGCRVASLPSGA